MLLLEKDDFTGWVDSLNASKSVFIIDTKRNRSELKVDGKFIGMYDKNRIHFKDKKKERDGYKLIASLASRVATAVNKFIVKSGCDIKKISQVHPQTNKNQNKYNSLECGAEFNYIDVKHCYWRIAYLYGYIGEKLYLDILQDQKMKTFRNMALACIVAGNTRKYYENGKCVREITEEKNLHRIVYDNIRFTSCNLMGNIMNKYSRYSLGYKVDGIMIVGDKASQEVIKEIELKQLQCTVVRCRKIDDKIYVSYEDGKAKYKQF